MKRREVLGGIIAVSYAIGANAAEENPFQFGSEAKIVAPQESWKGQIPDSEITFLQVCAEGAGGAFRARNKEELKLALDKLWKQAQARGVGNPQGWEGRVLTTNSSAAGVAPEISIWPGVVLRAEQMRDMWEMPPTFIPYTSPLYRAFLPLPPGLPVRFDATFQSLQLDGVGPYPYPLAFYVEFTEIAPWTPDKKK